MFYKLIFRKINATDAICNLKDYIAKKLLYLMKVIRHLNSRGIVTIVDEISFQNKMTTSLRQLFKEGKKIRLETCATAGDRKSRNE